MWENMNDQGEDKMLMIVDELKKFGITEDKIDDDLIWAVKKISHKINKLRLILDSKGVEQAKANEIIKGMVAEAANKDLVEVKEWHKEHEEYEHKGCCQHCNNCHHEDEERE